ncbi:uncharacterized protein LOC124499900 isoform X1 [Dermatophagoides farinae]|uniref:uncharacterized protein LOC124499900 isoform X1 n=1 Tax=Dermatophagoides farinae TaxID=6954 RepID=UPI003F613212
MENESKNCQTNENHHHVSDGKKFSNCWNNNNLDIDDDYVEDEMEEELDNVPPFNDSIALSSKLERYFTSGLLETTTTIVEKSQDHQQVKLLMDNKSLSLISGNVDHLNSRDHSHQQQQQQQQQHPINRRKFDKIGSLCNLLIEMISSIKYSKIMTITDDQTDDDDDLSIIFKHLDQQSCLYCLDLKRFIIKMILMLRLSNIDNNGKDDDDDDDHCYYNSGKHLKAIHDNNNNNNNDNKAVDDDDDDRLSIVRIIDRLSRREYINNDDDDDNRKTLCCYSRLQLEYFLITFMIEKIYRYTQINHLLFDHHFWSYEFNRLYGPASILKNQSSSSSSSASSSGKTIIKVTINGRLVPTTVENSFITGILSSTSSSTQQQSKVLKSLPKKSIFNQPKRFLSNNDSSIRVLQSNIEPIDLFRHQSKNPEYRTILHINNQQQRQQSGDWHGKKSSLSITDDDDDDDDDDMDDYCDDNVDIETRSSSQSSSSATTMMNNCTNKLNKFLRVSNPLNRSFLAKISPIPKESENNMKKSSINGEISVSSWANESMIDNANNHSIHGDDTHQSLMSNENNKQNEHSTIPKRSCSHEQLQMQQNLQQKSSSSSSSDHTSHNGSKKIDETKSSKVPTNNSSTNGHRNSFKNFSNSTLDHIYEMIRNPFKSSKKRKKISIDTRQNDKNGSKSLSEPNLNGSSTNKRQQRNTVCDSINNGDHVSSNENDSIDGGKVSYSKSTPQLMTNNNNNENGSNQSENLETIKLNQLHTNDELNGNNFRRNSARQLSEKNLNSDRENVCDCNHHPLISRLNGLSPAGRMKGNQRLQRSLSGSQISSSTSSSTTATSSIGFQRPKLSCIICEKNVYVSTIENRTNVLGNNNEIRASYIISSSKSTSLSSSATSASTPTITIPTSSKTVIQQSSSSSSSPSSSSHTTQSTSSTTLRSSISSHYILAKPFGNKFSSFRNNNNNNLQQQSSTKTSLISSYNNKDCDFKENLPVADNIQNQLEDSSENSDNTTMAIIGKICLSIYYETKLNSLTITIFRGHLNMVKKNKNDLYIKAYIIVDHQQEKAFKKKTKIKKPLKVDTSAGSLYEVEYNEILRFQGKWREFASGQLSVSLWNNDTFGRNTLLGQTLIRLNESVMLNSIQTRIWHDLHQPTKIKCQSVHVKGSLFVAIKHEDVAISSSVDGTGVGSLHVLIKEADDLNLTQYNINGYAYCKVMLKPERNKDDRHKTRTVKMGQCPRWNETIVFNNINRNDMNVKELEIAIMWLDKSSKTYLGSIRLTNHEGASNEERNLWRQSIERPNLWAYGKIPLRH